MAEIPQLGSDQENPKFKLARLRAFLEGLVEAGVNNNTAVFKGDKLGRAILVPVIDTDYLLPRKVLLGKWRGKQRIPLSRVGILAAVSSGFLDPKTVKYTSMPAFIGDGAHNVTRHRMHLVDTKGVDSYQIDTTLLPIVDDDSRKATGSLSNIVPIFSEHHSEHQRIDAVSHDVSTLRSLSPTEVAILGLKTGSWAESVSGHYDIAARHAAGILLSREVEDFL